MKQLLICAVVVALAAPAVAWAGEPGDSQRRGNCLRGLLDQEEATPVKFSHNLDLMFLAHLLGQHPNS